jgi:hypothetical protein
MVRRHPGGGMPLALVLFAVLAVAVLAPAAAGSSHRPQPKDRIAEGNPFATRGMWVWVLAASDHGSLQSIINQSHRYKINTLYIKSGDGTQTWSQFNPAVVSALHAGGLRVCAWQYVYGSYPLQEAQVGANAVRAGADCLAIDAESEYEGKYYQAQKYLTRLRQLIGSSFPVALAGLPYVDYHPSFPYSVFLGPGGAQSNVPQMYWHDIGTTVGDVFAHTYTYNRPYERPIYPLGQVYNSPPAWQIERFRQLLPDYGAGGVSWWDWQEAGRYTWKAISSWISNFTVTPAAAMPTLSKGAAGDLVVWAQEHLLSAGENLTVDGGFGKQTLAAVENFQLAHGLTVDGLIGTATWTALLAYPPANVTWSRPTTKKKGGRLSGPPTPAAVAAADAGREATPPEPFSALLPDKREELSGAPGAGRP